MSAVMARSYCQITRPVSERLSYSVTLPPAAADPSPEQLIVDTNPGDALTAQRRSEVAGLMWGELERETAIWLIPASRAKNGVAHIVPLAAAAVAVLDELAQKEAEKTSGAEPTKWPKTGFVLTTTGRTAISGISKAKITLDAAATALRDSEAISAWRIHDLRRTVATGFQRLGVRFEVTEAALNHVSGSRSGVAGIYQRHSWADEKRDALNAWADHVERIAHGADRTNVVPIRLGIPA